MSTCSKVEDKNISDSGSKVTSVHPSETKVNHTFRLKNLILSRLRVEFPLYDVADLGMVVQRLWNDIETDVEAK